LHRAVHIIVYNDNREIYVRERSKELELYPGVWTTSVGEHVFKDENYDKTARRALNDFLGLKGNLELVNKIRVHDKIENELVAVYKIHANSIPKLNLEHSVRGEFLSVENIMKLIEENSTTPHLAATLKVYSAQSIF